METETAAPAELSDYEKQRGKPMPGLNHSIVQIRLGVSLSAGAGDVYLVASELTLEFDDARALTPDLSVLPKCPLDWRHEQIRVRQRPLLVVEILSPTQGYQEIMDKLEVYFAHGVQSAWVVQPAMQSIALYQPAAARPQVFASQGEIRDPATGLTARLEEIFA